MRLMSRLLVIWMMPFCANSQSIDSIQKTFPGEEAVMQNYFLHYTISMKNNLPYVESDEKQQIKYLSDHAAGYMSKYGFVHSDFQHLTKYQAYTLTADNKKLKVNDFKTSSLRDGSVFYDDVKETAFDFPAVAPGSQGNLEISRVLQDPHLLSPFYFGMGMPVLRSELQVTFPKSMSIRYSLFGLDTAKVEISKDSHRGQITYTFRYINCPAGKRYPDAPSHSWYGTHVIFYIEKYTDDQGRQIPYLSNADDLYRLNYSFVKNINQEITAETKKLVDSLITNAHSDEQKARNIYEWVHHNIKYVAFEQGMEGFIPRDANLICSRRFGDCKDMSSILTMMLKQAGIPAFYTWLGTRDLAYNFSSLPLPLVSNHMICTILLDGNYIFLDGTHPTCVFGIPPDGIQGKEVMVAISEQEYKILKVPEIEKTKNVLTDSSFLELNEQGLHGKIKEENRGYFAMDLHAMLLYADARNLRDRFRSRLSRGSNKFQLDSLDFGDTKDPDKLSVSAEFRLPDYARRIGDEWFLNLNIFKFFEHEEIDYPKRSSPVTFDFKFVKNYVTVLKIPAGFKVSYLPEGKSYHNEVWGFTMKYELKGNLVILTQQFDNDWLIMQPAQFQDWNKVLENLFPLYKQTISLSKI